MTNNNQKFYTSTKAGIDDLTYDLMRLKDAIAQIEKKMGRILQPYTNEYVYNLANRGNNMDRDCITDRTYQLEDFAKEVFFNAYTEKADASLHMDLLQHAIGAVNWREILMAHMELEPQAQV